MRFYISGRTNTEKKKNKTKENSEKVDDVAEKLFSLTCSELKQFHKPFSSQMEVERLHTNGHVGELQRRDYVDMLTGRNCSLTDGASDCRKH